MSLSVSKMAFFLRDLVVMISVDIFTHQKLLLVDVMHAQYGHTTMTT